MIRYILTISILILLSSCSSDNKPTSQSENKPTPGLFSKDSEKGVSITDILSGKKSDGTNVNVVNGYLWRASLNILSIAPLISTDALGGTIITDWYVNKNIQNQRLKITAFIKTSELRSDGIEVKVYIQNFKNNAWSETYTNNQLANKIEESILNEARNLRNNSSN
tara:strand:+ start:82 stop:579 length:498 start_codon:yes stop_codon:yes gene_type:complete